MLELVLESESLDTENRNCVWGFVWGRIEGIWGVFRTGSELALIPKLFYMRGINNKENKLHK